MGFHRHGFFEATNWTLFAKAVTYLGTPNFNHPAFSDDEETLGGESEQLAEGDAREFMQWDEELRMAHSGNIEREVASLRYGNAVLAEENRRLKLAYAAVEAIRHDLECDRAALLAAKEQAGQQSVRLSQTD